MPVSDGRGERPERGGELSRAEDRSGEGLPRRVRLRRSPDYARAQRTGRRYHTPNLVVIVFAGPGRVLSSGEASDGPRFGLAVSKKVGNAVVRNRVKRWLRESIRRQRSVVGAVDVVLIARPSAAAAGYGILSAEVGDAFARWCRGRG